MYDSSLEYFPKDYSIADVMSDKANLMYDEKMADDAKLYAMLTEAFNKDKKNFDNPKSLYLYFSSLVDLHAAGKKDLQEVFDVYDDVTEQIETVNEKYLAGTGIGDLRRSVTHRRAFPGEHGEL